MWPVSSKALIPFRLLSFTTEYVLHTISPGTSILKAKSFIKAILDFYSQKRVLMLDLLNKFVMEDAFASS